MTEDELEQYCSVHPNCDCKCMKCEAFAKHIRTELGYNDK